MFAVIFRSVRTDEHEDLYQQWANRMSEAVMQIAGYHSHMSFRDPATRAGVTIAYFETEEAIHQWREFPDHLAAQELGREMFYLEYTVEVAQIVRDYSWSKMLSN
jgi:heme-degrading monooxygenase HmoA